MPGDKKMIEQVIALDPLTASILALDQIHNMVEQIFKLQAPYTREFS